MDDQRPGFPLRYFLPIIQFLICLVVLQPYWFSLRAHVMRYVQQFERSLLGGDQSGAQSTTILNVTIESPTQPIFEPRWATPAALDLPVGFVQVPFVLASDEKAEWVPEGMLLGEWRALTWPFLGCIFWWVAGRGLEALFAAARARRFAIIRPRLHWAEVTTGACLFALGTGAGVLFAFGQNPTGLMTHWLFAASAGLWGVLGAVIIAARLLQARIRRLARLDAIAYVP